MFVKRFTDIFLSSVFLILLLPIMAVVALAIKIEGGGPILFRQIRVGYLGSHFEMYKFRSMNVDAVKVGGYSTIPNDPRVTGVGQIIRKTSLDELPQLFNVLLGHMSLVGPRPDVPAQRSNYTEFEWKKRFMVRPGITGLAQAKLRSAATMEQRKKMDLEYVDNWNLWVDFKICLLTLKIMLTQLSY